MNKLSDLIIRYAILLILGLNGLFIIYFLISPITIYLSFFALNIISNATLSGNSIFFRGIQINLIPACIAGSAYYLLLILNLTTPMDKKTRTKSLLFIIGLFFILNILRIIVFSILFSNKYSYFDFAHESTWYIGSTILIMVIWFANVRIFKINHIPIYSDMRLIYKESESKKIKSKK